MNPLLASISKALARALMLAAGSNGIDVNDSQAETIVNGLLVAIPIVWSIAEKCFEHWAKQRAEGK
jgi:hypothetical protein